MRKIISEMFGSYFHSIFDPPNKNPRTQLFINDLPLKLLEIILVGVFITMNITVIQKMADIGYNIFYMAFNSTIIYIPIFYTFLIYIMAYNQKELLSDKRMRNALHATSALSILIAMAQITEFRPLFSEVLTFDDFITAYINNCPFHAFCCIILSFVLLFVRIVILRRKLFFFILLNLYFIRSWWGPTITHNIDELISKIIDIGGFQNIEPILFILALIFLFIILLSVKLIKFYFTEQDA